MNDGSSEKSDQGQADSAPTGAVAGVFAPLLGLQPASVPIVVQEGLEIDRMTDAEIREIETWGITAGDMVRPQYAVRFQRPVIEQRQPDSVEAATERFHIEETGYGLIGRVICALRLFKQGSISAPLLVSGPPFRDNAHHGSYLEQPQTGVVIYDLSADEANEFVAFIHSSWDGLNASALDYSIRRFSQAVTRLEAEDQIIDLMIACESLLLPDRAGELGYRMALRFVFSADRGGNRRRQLFDEMMAAYEIRSWIVHGKTGRAPKLPNGQKMDLGGLIMFARSLAELVRRMLRDAVIAAQNGNWPPDWDTMILQDP